MVELRPATRDDIPALTVLVRRCDESHRSWAGADVRMPDPENEELEWDLRFARTGAWIQVAVDPGAAAPGGIVGAVAFARATGSREDRTPVPGLGHVSAV